MALQYSDPQVFLFLSQILGKRVFNRQNRKIGKVMDLAVGMVEPYPIVTEVLLSPAGSGENFCVPWSKVLEMDKVLRLDDFSTDECRKPESRAGEIFLKDTLMDKQVVDTNGAKVRRVNDLQFLKAHQPAPSGPCRCRFPGTDATNGIGETDGCVSPGFYGLHPARSVHRLEIYSAPVLAGSAETEDRPGPSFPDASGRSGGYY